MRRRMAFVVAWFVVTGISVLIATQAVGTVRDQVTDSPATLSPVASSFLIAASTTDGASSTTTQPGDGTTSTAATSTTEATTTTISPTTTVPTATTQPTTTAAPRTTTSTTAAPTTTAAPPAMEVATYQLTGGWVRIRYGGGDVILVDAAPYAGFSMKIEKDGPEKVEVEFDGKDYEGKFKADMEDGPLEVDIDESDGHD